MFSIKFLIIISVTLMFVSCTHQQKYTKDSNKQQPQDKKVFHIIKKGDTLWKISRRYKVGTKKIMEANKLNSPNNLKIAEKLIIPINTDKNNKFLWPAYGKIVNPYNKKNGKIPNKGIDIELGKDKTIIASNLGEVVFSDNLGAWNKTIILKHPNNFYTIYANLDKMLVSSNQNVKKGQAIASYDSSGTKTVHFEIRKDYIPKNPLNYLN
ncbi:MAG: peptidoglycan DD-metalloendopeptidase family protein [Candidatus Omnitrophota bacterium]